ncbi:protein FAM166B-like [Micropterus salmoides]|uniref:protein FAM166B-like n=1 Tax=Micropterus salmoides TaxID=27706 RepID=UPI0018ECB10A|nr:protein FAM166B-like [Micropterus salmoides]
MALITGFTGHVPKSRFLIGKGYPITTNQALIQFGKQQQSDPTSQDIPNRKDSTITTLPTIYPSNRGVVPSFTGHIPGYQFMYGHTFGQLSQNALEKSGIKRILQAKS